MAEGNSQLVRYLYRSLLRDARRIRQHKDMPFLFLQKRSSWEVYSHLWEIKPLADKEFLNSVLPSDIRKEIPSCELTGEELARITRKMFQTFKNLGKKKEKSRSELLPTVDEAIDDLLGIHRLMNDQMSLFECTSVTTTYGLRVIATAMPSSSTPVPEFVEDSMASGLTTRKPPYFFFYNIRIENNHPFHTYQLLGRHWVIEDSSRNVVQVIPKNSPGVVGQQPILPPGHKISYVSGANLPTSHGSMRGSFQIVVKNHSSKSADALADRTTVAFPGDLNHDDAAPPSAFDALVNRFILK